MQSDGTTREKLWLDDMISAIHAPLKFCSNPISETVREAEMKAMLFCFTGKGEVNGQAVHKWSMFRKELRQEVVRAHASQYMLAGLGGLPGIDAATCAPGDLAAALMKQLGEEEEAGAGAGTPAATALSAGDADLNRLTELFADGNSGLVRFCEFLVENPLGRPVKFQSAFMKLQVALYEQVQGLMTGLSSGQQTECQHIFSLLARAVREVLPCKWLAVASLVCSLAAKCTKLPEDLQEQVDVLFSSGSEGAEQFLALRATYILELLVSLWQSTSSSTLLDHVQDIATADVLCAWTAGARADDGNTHARFWEVFGFSYIVEARGIKDSIAEAERKAGPKSEGSASGAAAAASTPTGQGQGPSASATAPAAVLVSASSASVSQGEDQDQDAEKKQKEISLVNFKDLQVDLVEGAEAQAGITPTPAILKKLCSSLETFLFGVAAPGVVGGDSGHAHLYLQKEKLKGKEVGVYFKNEGNVMLQFYGRVTLVPVVGCIHLCSAFGLDFFVSPTGSEDALAEHCVPAWLVRVVDSEAKEQERVDKLGMALPPKFRFASPRSVKVPYTWTHTPILASPKKLELKLTVWRIDYKCDPATGQEELVRGPIGSQITKVSTPRTTKGQGKGKGDNSKSKKAATDAQNEPQWRDCKHLFL